MLHSALQHAAGQFRFAGKRDLIGNASTPPTLTILGPGLGHVQGTIQKGMPQRTGIEEQDANLAIFDPSSGATD